MKLAARALIKTLIGLDEIDEGGRCIVTVGCGHVYDAAMSLFLSHTYIHIFISFFISMLILIFELKTLPLHVYTHKYKYI